MWQCYGKFGVAVCFSYGDTLGFGGGGFGPPTEGGLIYILNPSLIGSGKGQGRISPLAELVPLNSAYPHWSTVLSIPVNNNQDPSTWRKRLRGHVM